MRLTVVSCDVLQRWLEHTESSRADNEAIVVCLILALDLPKVAPRAASNASVGVVLLNVFKSLLVQLQVPVYCAKAFAYRV